MNYVAGFILGMYESPDEAYGVFDKIVYKYDLGTLFNEEMKGLHLRFFIADKLISKMLP